MCKIILIWFIFTLAHYHIIKLLFAQLQKNILNIKPITILADGQSCVYHLKMLNEKFVVVILLFVGATKIDCSDRDAFIKGRLLKPEEGCGLSNVRGHTRLILAKH